MTEQPVVQSSVMDQPSADRVNAHRSVYDASAGEIFWKNFLAGVSRGIGSVLVNLIFFVAMAYVFSMYIWPQIQPLLTSYNDALGTIKSLQQMQTTITGGGPTGGTTGATGSSNSASNFAIDQQTLDTFMKQLQQQQQPK